MVGLSFRNDLPDNDLVLLARSHDEQAAVTLAMRHHEKNERRIATMLHDVHLAEDALQLADMDTVTAFREDGFRGDSAFGTWYYTVAKNEGLLLMRGRSRYAARIDRFHSRVLSGELQQPQSPEPVAEVLLKEQRDMVLTAMMLLGSEHAVALRLVYFEGLSNGEAAECLEIAESCFKTRLYRARIRLKELLSH